MIRKRPFITALALALALFVSGLALADGFEFTDARGRAVFLQESPKRVAALLGSYAEAWLEAGGSLAGTTRDAIEERGLCLSADTAIVGGAHEPSLEAVLALSPDFVILSSAQPSHLRLGETLSQTGIACAYFDVNTYGEYLEMLRVFLSINGGMERYHSLSEPVGGAIEEIIKAAQADPRYGQMTAILLRASSGSVRIKGSDNLAGAVLQDMGLKNLADTGDWEDLTLEAILEADPDYLFAVTMGEDDEKALTALEAFIAGNPAWAGLSAVRGGRYYVLPKDLFHYKPNARWAEAYRMILDIVYAK